ncbi:MAG: c-type cytochrome [Candidatus Zixiibacteriota bacterium]|nr:MAG: c-type cytochrome [candidate division Zixibacteria bacterium]
MDFPMFFLDIAGNRMLIAVIASVHVFINHALAVGAYPLVTLMEWRAWRSGDAGADRLAYRVTFVLFIVTTSLGALTGVGIWFSTSLIAPFGIGSLLRVFFWAWFIEWLVFISEVILILAYFLTWKRWREGSLKKLHIGLGAALSVFSWFTMAIIVAVLGFMMDPGGWLADPSLFSALLNPVYLPQLAFRTTYALGVAGLCVWFMLFFFTEKGSRLRHNAVRMTSGWMLVWVVPFIAACLWYWKVVPDTMAANIDVALLTQRFQNWHETLATIMAATIAVLVLVALAGRLRPALMRGFILLVPFILGLWLLGHFERVREFIRKPHVIAGYMYSNGIKVADLPVFQRDGVLPYAAYVRHHGVTPANTVEAGRDVFLVACSRCHTTTGINSVTSKFANLYGEKPFNEPALTAFIETMHTGRTYMPPFPGSEAEVQALVAYVKRLQTESHIILDAATMWGESKTDRSGVVASPAAVTTE